MSDILKDLAAPFPPDVVSWRVGATTKDKAKGMALAYIDARDVQDRLNAVCGLEWQVRNPWASEKKLACEIGIKIGGEWLWRGDGAGDSDVEAEKGAFSDAFKRAAVRWGIGRYLYDMESPWVELKAAGNSYAIADHERERLRKLLASKVAPAPKPAATPTKPPAASAQKAPQASKRLYELLDANSAIVDYNTPDEWCRALQTALREPGARVRTIWEANKPLLETINDQHPALRWEIKGQQYHPYDVLAALYEKLAPGMAA